MTPSRGSAGTKMRPFGIPGGAGSSQTPSQVIFKIPHHRATRQVDGMMGWVPAGGVSLSNLWDRALALQFLVPGP